MGFLQLTVVATSASLLLATHQAAADGAIAFCGEITERDFGSIAHTRLVTDEAGSGERIDILYCDRKGQCKVALQMPSTDFRSMQWMANLKLLVSTNSLDRDGRRLAVNFSPRGADYASTLAVVEDGSNKYEGASELLSFDKSKCETGPSPIEVE